MNGNNKDSKHTTTMQKQQRQQQQQPQQQQPTKQLPRVLKTAQDMKREILSRRRNHQASLPILSSNTTATKSALPLPIARTSNMNDHDDDGTNDVAEEISQYPEHRKRKTTATPSRMSTNFTKSASIPLPLLNNFKENNANVTFNKSHQEKEDNGGNDNNNDSNCYFDATSKLSHLQQQFKQESFMTTMTTTTTKNISNPNLSFRPQSSSSQPKLHPKPQYHHHQEQPQNKTIGLSNSIWDYKRSSTKSTKTSATIAQTKNRKSATTNNNNHHRHESLFGKIMKQWEHKEKNYHDHTTATTTPTKTYFEAPGTNDNQQPNRGDDTNKDDDDDDRLNIYPLSPLTVRRSNSVKNIHKSNKSINNNINNNNIFLQFASSILPSRRANGASASPTASGGAASGKASGAISSSTSVTTPATSNITSRKRFLLHHSNYGGGSSGNQNIVSTPTSNSRFLTNTNDVINPNHNDGNGVDGDRKSISTSNDALVSAPSTPMSAFLKRPLFEGDGAGSSSFDHDNEININDSKSSGNGMNDNSICTTSKSSSLSITTAITAKSTMTIPSPMTLTNSKSLDSTSMITTITTTTTKSPPRKKIKQWDISSPNVSQQQTFPHLQYYQSQHATPKRTPIRTPSRTTPNYRKTPTSMSRYYNSPGGFALQRLLEGCRTPQLAYNSNKRFTSLQHHKHHHKSSTSLTLGPFNDDDVEADDDEKSTRSTNSATTSANGLDDWYEESIRLPRYDTPPPNTSLIDRTNYKDGNNQENSNTTLLVRGEVSIVDWSIKSMLKFECHPGNCIPGRAFPIIDRQQQGHYSIPNEYQVERLAMSLFTNHLLVHDTTKIKKTSPLDSSSSSTMREFEHILAQWNAGLMYYQHPSIHPLPCSILNKNQKTISESVGGQINSTKSFNIGSSLLLQGFPTRMNSETSRSKLFSKPKTRIKDDSSYPSLSKSVYGSEAKVQQRSILSGIGCLGGLGNSYGDGTKTTSISSLLEQREYDWQECFRSLYQMWIGEIQQLNHDISINDKSVDGHIEDLASRLYFYSIKPGTTILFRATVEYDNKVATVMPLILLSSSTFEMRSILRSMGATLKCVDTKNKSKSNLLNVDEDFIDEWFKEKITVHSNNNNIDENLRKEMEELRKASVNEEALGGEIAFSLHNGKTTTKTTSRKKQSDFPPLLIYDHEDCNIFFEFYLNTCGGKINKTSMWKKQNIPYVGDSIQDVPLLLSRSLGAAAARYMTIRQLSVICNNKVSKDDKLMTDDDADENDGGSSSHALVEVRGPILPCAVRDLLCASISHSFFHDKQYQQQTCKRHDSDGDEKKTDPTHSQGDYNIQEGERDELGSHYFVLHLHPHEGEKIQVVATKNHEEKIFKKSIGSTSSGLFNIGCGYGPGNNSNDGISSLVGKEEQLGKSRTDSTSSTNSMKMYECHANEIMSMAVWDNTRPFSIACKGENHK